MAILIIFPLKLGLGSLNCRLVDKRDAVLEPLNKKGLLINRFLLGLVFDDKVEDGAATVGPGVEVEGHTSGGDFQERLGHGHGGFGSLCLGADLFALLTNANPANKVSQYEGSGCGAVGSAVASTEMRGSSRTSPVWE